MKKVLSPALLTLLLLFSVFGFEQSSAEAAEVNLLGNQSSASTVRVTANSKLSIYTRNYSSSYDIRYAIFRNGVEYRNGYLLPGQVNNFTLNVSPGQYSLRLYCGGATPRPSGCLGYGSINGS